jgi:uncharacterized membrane protein
MGEVLNSPFAGLVMLGAITATLVACGVYVIGKVRAGMKGTEPKASEYLTNFEELHAQGELSDEEYRTIKAVLAERLQQELKVTDETR